VRSLRHVLLCLLSTITLAPVSAQALVFAGNLPIPFVGQMKIVDDLAYVVTNFGYQFGIPTLRILDFSDPNNPVEIGSLDTHVPAEGIEVVGGFAYITDRAAGGGKLRIVDVSNPRAPVEVGAFTAAFRPMSVAVSGGYAYLADQFYAAHCSPPLCGSALHVLDISNPAAPVQVWEDYRAFTGGIKVVDDILYIPYLRGPALGGLELFDVSNPESPTTLGLEPDDLGEAIAVANGKVYMTASLGPPDPVTLGRYGFAAIDVADPSDPVRIGRATSLGTSIELAGKLAYVAAPGMTVVDVSDPAAPRRRGSIGAAVVDDLTIYEGRAYLAAGFQGLQVVDLSVLDTPAEVGFAAAALDPLSGMRPTDVAVSDGVAYMTLGWLYRYDSPGSFRTFDVTNPREPLALGSVDTTTPALDVELEAGFAYVAADRGGLQVFDVTTLSAPTAVGNLALPGSTAKVAVVGGIAYAVDRGIWGESGVALRVLDVSEPSAPTELGVIELGTTRSTCVAPGMAVVGKRVFLTCSHFNVVDVSDPTQPVLIYAIEGVGFESSIDIEGELAYIVQDESSLNVFDVSDPAQPVHVYQLDCASKAGMLVHDGFAYSAGSSGLVVHDLADPRRPVLRGGYPIDRGGWNGLTIADGLVYGVSNSGLQIIDLGPEYTHALPVDIAIRADGTAAPINLAARGLIPVTVFGTADFDVAEIDRSTLRFGPDSATPAHKAGGHLADLNGDGHPDLLSHYQVEASGISSADQEACVTGQTASGKSFRGCASLTTLLPPGQAVEATVAN
jgi:hypothetical protein